MRIVLALIISALLFACEKEEELLPGRFLTDQIGQVDMVSEGGVDYQMQLYFDMSSGTMKASNKRDVWDLALGCDLANPNIYVNPAMSLSVASTGSTDFSTVFDPASLSFEFERSGHYYTKAWISNDLQGGTAAQEVFIINLSRDLSNQERGYKKLQIVSVQADAYVLRISDLDNNNLKEVTLKVDPTYNYVFVSLDSPEQTLKLEPPKDEWDLHFTKYMERLYDGTDTLDYSVTGCMINSLSTSAYYDTISSLDSTISYSSLRIEDVDQNQLSNRQNGIGHEWKYFDLDAGTFLVRGNMNFFIKDQAGTTYRMHFTGFYNNEGQKGAVSFEYLPL